VTLWTRPHDSQSPPRSMSSPGISSRVSTPRESIHVNHIHAPWKDVKSGSRFQDTLPEGPSANLEAIEHQVVSPTGIIIRIQRSFKTTMNRFGLYRVYPRKPTGIPASSDASTRRLLRANVSHSSQKRQPRKIADIIWPFPNVSAFLLGNWHRNGSNVKSQGEFQKLQEVLTSPMFNSQDIVGVDFDMIDSLLAEDVQSPWDEGNGWRTSSVTIAIPTGEKNTKAAKKARKRADALNRRTNDGGLGDEEVDAVTESQVNYTVHNVHHRSLTHILKTTVAEAPAAHEYNWHAYEEWWQPPGGRPAERVRTDIADSDAFLEAQELLLSSPGEPDCDLPRVIIALMAWSDATHVTQFGNSKLWPFYFMLGNLTKYTRCQPNARCAYHGLFCPSVSL